MNAYQKVLNKATNQKMDNEYLKVKKKYSKKWLEGGTPVTHPIFIAYEKDLNKIGSYNSLRKILKSEYKNLNELKKLNKKLSKNNKKRSDELFSNK